MAEERRYEVDRRGEPPPEGVHAHQPDRRGRALCEKDGPDLGDLAWFADGGPVTCPACLAWMHA